MNIGDLLKQIQIYHGVETGHFFCCHPGKDVTLPDQDCLSCIVDGDDFLLFCNQRKIALVWGVTSPVDYEFVDVWLPLDHDVTVERVIVVPHPEETHLFETIICTTDLQQLELTLLKPSRNLLISY